MESSKLTTENGSPVFAADVGGNNVLILCVCLPVCVCVCAVLLCICDCCLHVGVTVAVLCHFVYAY